MGFPSCGVHDQTVQYIAQTCGYTSAQVYAAFQLLHTDARESTVAAMMKGWFPDSGLCCTESIRKIVWKLMKDVVQKLEPKWLHPHQEWINDPENLKYPEVLKDKRYTSCQVIGSGDTNPIKCVSTLTGAFQPKYQENVIKPFTIALHTGLFIYVSTKTYTGSSSDNVILQSELEKSEILRELLLKYGLLLDGGFHPTSIRRGKECDDAEDRRGKGCDGAEEEGDEQEDDEEGEEAGEEEGDGKEGDMGLAKLFFPIRKPKIWRKYRAEHESIEEYMAHVEYCLEYNERHGFMRARIEHRYGPSGIGHFSGLMERRWLHDVDYVLFAFKFVCIGRNIDTIKKWGTQGGYVNFAPSDEYFRRAPINSKRFPRPTDKKTKILYPLPFSMKPKPKQAARPAAKQCEARQPMEPIPSESKPKPKAKRQKAKPSQAPQASLLTRKLAGPKAEQRAISRICDGVVMRATRGAKK